MPQRSDRAITGNQPSFPKNLAETAGPYQAVRTG